MPRDQPALRLGAYALVVALLLVELWVVWLIGHPNVSANYRAYYLDQTTTCLDQPVSGTYRLGRLVSFLPDGAASAKPLRVCGWEGPVGDGTHAVGTSTRLRFVFRPDTRALTLALEMIAVIKDGVPTRQRVDLLVNGHKIGQVSVGAERPQRFSVPIPPELAAAAQGRIDLALEFPDAVQMGPSDPDTRWRSIKLLHAGLLPRPAAVPASF